MPDVAPPAQPVHPPDTIMAPAVSGSIAFVPTATGLELRIDGIPALIYSEQAAADQLIRAAQLGWELTQLKRGLP